MGFSHPGTAGRRKGSRMGARKAVPSSTARMVPLGEGQISFRPYSSCRWRLAVMVAHFTATPSRRVALAASSVT